MTKTILLTHTPDMRRNYYGERALAGLNALATVRFHESDAPLAGTSLIEAAAGCAVIVSDRQTPGDAAIFGALPNLVAFVRCAVDIRNVAVPAASANGVLVTHASAGFIASVAELVLGSMIDLGRHVTPAATTYHGGVAPTALRGIQLRGSTLGILGYGAIGRYLADLGVALGMNVLVADPYAKVDKTGIVQTDMPDLLTRADFVVCLVVANEETENLMNDAAFARMKPSAYFINVSRGNLVDEAALARALDAKRIADDIQLFLRALANGVHVRARMPLINGDKLRSESETDYGNVDLSTHGSRANTPFFARTVNLKSHRSPAKTLITSANCLTRLEFKL